MAPMRLEVPELVRQRALANGAAGRDWLEALPQVVTGLTTRWGLTLADSYATGTAGLVAAATDSEGLDCVLKVAMPLDIHEAKTFARSVEVHRFAAGRGCAQLFDHDDDAPAMLLERLGPNLDELGLDVSQILVAIAETLKVFWQPVGSSLDFPTGAESAACLADYIAETWEELGRPCPRAVLDQALQYCDSRADAFDPVKSVLIHGDAHGWNTVSAGDGGYKFVDPEGAISEPAQDLAVAMREYNEPRLAGETKQLVWERAELLAGLCDVDVQAVWEWGFIERVSTGLAGLRDFEGDDGLMFLEVAERCL